MALVALGGYGRQELCPGSDLDLLLLHRGRPDVNDLAAQVWYPIWDERLSLDHSVRTVRDAVATAENDVRTGLTMLDARLVVGDASLVEELGDRLARSLGRLARRWLRLLDESVVARHARAGDVAFLLEPDLKEGKGGLRDAGVLRAVGSLLDFVAVDEGTDAARDELLTIRVELHRTVGRLLDTLLLQDQDEVGRRTGLGGGDEVMAAVAAAGRRISWASDDAWSRIRAWIEGPRRIRTGGRARDLGQGVVRVDDEIGVTGRDDPDLGRWLHAAAAAAEMRVPFARDTVRRMAAADPEALPTPWPRPALDDLLALLATGAALVPVFETLDHYGLWTALLPEWEPVRNRPQRNAFHHFTVDRHLIEAVVQAAPLAPSVTRPDVLVLAALLHDIGKGYPGDHTEVGVGLVATIGARLGLAAADGELVQDLVRLHLLLPDTATRRDLDDPKTVALVADEVGTVATLDLLAALTEADARATGPTAWTPWRAGLVAALVERVRIELTGAGSPALEPPLAPTADVRADDGATVIGDGITATVVAPDRPGLFCAVAGVLALHGLDILGATATGRADGMAVEAFRVQPTVDRDPPWDLVQRDLRAVLDGRLSLDEQLARRRRVYGDDRAQQAASPPEVDVHFLDQVSDTSTVVDVRGPATMGALFRITRQFAALGLDIRHARVTTVGNQAIDSFYVTDARQQTVEDPALRRRLATAIVHDLEALT